MSQRFLVPFDEALHAFPREFAVSGCEFVPADAVDPDRLFELDLLLRHDVPGLHDWQPNRVWFDAEMVSAEFDPTGYLVARRRSSDELLGLIRFWHQNTQPQLGLLAVIRSWRGSSLATALLRAGLLGASAWGYEAFETHTGRPSLQRRLDRMGATRLPLARAPTPGPPLE